jgi:hypothetical protein
LLDGYGGFFASESPGALPAGIFKCALQPAAKADAPAESEIDFEHKRKIGDADRRVAAVKPDVADFRSLRPETEYHDEPRVVDAEAQTLLCDISYINRENYNIST